jgi:hypothetical protein
VQAMVEAPPRAQRDDDKAPGPALTTAEVAECNCPEFCERDHDNE